MDWLCLSLTCNLFIVSQLSLSQFAESTLGHTFVSHADIKYPAECPEQLRNNRMQEREAPAIYERDKFG